MPESQRIFEQLNQVFAQLADISARQVSDKEKDELWRAQFEDALQHIRKRLDQQNALLTGNGTPERGLVVRIDRIEQDEKRRGLLHKTAIGASITAIIAAIAAILKSHLTKQ